MNNWLEVFSSLNKSQALAKLGTNLCFPTDSKNIVFNGKEYGEDAILQMGNYSTSAAAELDARNPDISGNSKYVILRYTISSSNSEGIIIQSVGQTSTTQLLFLNGTTYVRRIGFTNTNKTTINLSNTTDWSTTMFTGIEYSPSSNSLNVKWFNQTLKSTIIPLATTSSDGLMSRDDKIAIQNLLNRGTQVEYKTYAQLLNLRNSSQLNPGQKYRITDYVCQSSDPDTLTLNHNFDIIVEALTANQLSHNAQAAPREGDTYFDVEDLAQWQLKYDIDNDSAKYDWAPYASSMKVLYRGVWYVAEGTEVIGSITYYKFSYFSLSRNYSSTDTVYDSILFRGQPTGGDNVNYYYLDGVLTQDQSIYTVNFTKPEILQQNCRGVIYYMRDHKGNEAGYDFKNIEFFKKNGYYMSPFLTFGESIDYSQVGNACYENIIRPIVISGKYHLNHIVFKISDLEDKCYNNKLGPFCQDLSFGATNYNNEIGASVTDCNFPARFHDNKIGNRCSRLYFDYSSYRYCVFEDDVRHVNMSSSLDTSSSVLIGAESGHINEGSVSAGIFGANDNALTLEENSNAQITILGDQIHVDTYTYFQYLKVRSGIKGSISSTIQIPLTSRNNPYAVTFFMNESGNLQSNAI